MRQILFTIICALALYPSYHFNVIALSYNVVRPLFLEDGGDNCLQDLKDKNINFERIGQLRNRQCLIKNAVRIDSFPQTKLSGPITVSCSTAKTLQSFFKEIQADTITHLGSYNCRSIRNNRFISEHGYGTALDISHINNASVEIHWGSDTEEGRVLNKSEKVARTMFSNVVTPESNASHYDHIHLDQGLGL